MKKNYQAERINYHRNYVDTLTDPNVFDIIVMHFTINNIGEDILEDILCNNAAYIDFVSRLKTILDQLSTGGILIVSDCGSINFFVQIGLKSLFAPFVDWDLRCEPGVWQQMTEDLGFSHIKTQWTDRREFGFLERFFFSIDYAFIFLTFILLVFIKKAENSECFDKKKLRISNLKILF